MKRVVRIGLNPKFDYARRPFDQWPVLAHRTRSSYFSMSATFAPGAGPTANANGCGTVGGCLEWQQIVDVQQPIRLNDRSSDPLRPWNLPMGRIVSTGKTLAVPTAKSGRIRLCGDNSTKETRANQQRRQKSVCQLQ